MEMGFSGTNVFLNLYVLDSLGSDHALAGGGGGGVGERSSITSRRVEKSHRRHFLEQVTMYKNMLHLNSSVYDFHVELFASFVLSPSDVLPSFPLVDLLEAFGDLLSVPQNKGWPSRQNKARDVTRLQLEAQPGVAHGRLRTARR